MCLTEPNAGSDVGDLLTKAYPTDEPGVYKIKGTKCFITGGDQDITENIVHLVLARVEGARPGTKGISLFAVPKMWVDDDGNITGSNDVACIGIEHKMGIKGSATCVMSFGENNECRGYILGNPPDEEGKGEGMAQMFQMMNGARMETGHAALAETAVAFHNAASYANERIQGRLITDPKAGRQLIIKHEDVRRMLLDLKAHVDAMRALIFKTYYYFDILDNTTDPEEKQLISGRIDIHTLWSRLIVLIKPGNCAPKPCRYLVVTVIRKNILLLNWLGTSRSIPYGKVPILFSPWIWWVVSG